MSIFEDNNSIISSNTHSVKPKLVNNLKLPGTTPATPGSRLDNNSIGKKDGLKFMEDLKLPRAKPKFNQNEEFVIKNDPLTQRSDGKRISKVYKDVQPVHAKPPPMGYPKFEGQKTPRKTVTKINKPKINVPKLRPPSLGPDSSPVVPGKLIPVYIYRHGRRMPVTSFRVIFYF